MDTINEPAISLTFVGWTEDWEKNKWKTDGTVNKVLFSNKYEYLHFVWPDTYHVYYICEEDIVFLRHYGWTIYAQCDVPGVKVDEVTIFLAVTLIHKTPEAVCIKVKHPEQGSDHDRWWDPDEENE